MSAVAESMVDRAARAMMSDEYGQDGWNVTSEQMRNLWRLRARAAIAAMREPSEAMLIGARDWSLKKYGIGVGNDGAIGCWQAMIDAGLAEERSLNPETTSAGPGS